jgi:hypothetical protein
MKLLMALLLLTACTPMTSAMKSSQSSAQDSTQGMDSTQGLSHASRTSDMPIIIICNHVGRGDSDCIQRNVPFDELKAFTQ